MNYILIPSYRRAEMIHICLELLSKNKNYKDFHYVFSLDHGYDKENLTVINGFDASKEIIYVGNKNLGHTKQSFNVLNGLRYCAERTDNLVFLIEDDIFVANDYLDWNLLVHEQEPNIFCSIGTWNHNTIYEVMQELSLYYKSNNADYQSWAVCYKKEIIQKHIIPHVNENYLKDPYNYCRTYFPSSRIKRNFTEQDGLIRRELERQKMKTVFPNTPRAFNCGLYGKHNNGYLRMPLTDKIQYVKDNCFDAMSLLKIAKGEDIVRHLPCELNNPKLEFVKYDSQEK